MLMQKAAAPVIHSQEMPIVEQRPAAGQHS
ncbi:hypothetical protein J2T49_000323 [Pseudomonas nitroreducens]|nr:hypothetical protein [Pseudomonas nitroreducens]MCP1684396.1 hypothetical protein [Pseudomonas nitroreducens]